jgi:hypothetical protein
MAPSTSPVQLEQCSIGILLPHNPPLHVHTHIPPPHLEAFLAHPTCKDLLFLPLRLSFLNPRSDQEPTVTRTQEEALEMIKGFHDQLVRGEVTFDALAAKESHCSSAQRGGDLGEFG